MARPVGLLNSTKIRKRSRDSGRGIYRNQLINSDKGLVQPTDKIVAAHDLSLFVRHLSRFQCNLQTVIKRIRPFPVIVDLDVVIPVHGVNADDKNHDQGNDSDDGGGYNCGN